MACLGHLRQKNHQNLSDGCLKKWLRGPDLNRQPSGYEPDELPDCSTPRCYEKYGGGRRIRTFEGVANRFTVCPLWPAWVSLHAKLLSYGAGGGNRIHNLSITSRVLCQLSYTGATIKSIASKSTFVNCFSVTFFLSISPTEYSPVSPNNVPTYALPSAMRYRSILRDDRVHRQFLDNSCLQDST